MVGSELNRTRQTSKKRGETGALAREALPPPHSFIARAQLTERAEHGNLMRTTGRIQWTIPSSEDAKR